MSYFEREARAQRAQDISIGDIAASLQVSEAQIERALLGEFVVRVVLARWVGGDPVSDFITALSKVRLFTLHRDDDDGICFDILPPQSGDSQKWSKKVAASLIADGFNAVSAPRWPDES